MNHKLSSTRPKPSDPAGEPQRRNRALEALSHALADEAEIIERASRLTTQRAETAVWLGASLADLALVTGRTRQAARKRWPSLGPISRQRRWLGNHVDDILWAARLLDQHADSLPAGATTHLPDALAATTAAFAEEFTSDTEPLTHWLLLDALVDQNLRAAGEHLGPARTEEGDFARHGAAGVVAHYDHALRQDADEFESDPHQPVRPNPSRGMA